MIRPLLLFLFLSCGAFANVKALYLSWYEDPTTTMTIHWHTQDHESEDTIYFQNKESNEWIKVTGSHTQLQNLFIHTVHLSQLNPDTDYYFRIGEDPTPYIFRTAPSNPTTPMRFIIGGDADHTTKLFRKMNQTIVKKDPLFCVIGGDIAYALNRAPFHFNSGAFNQWISFLSTWKEQMVTPEGRLIPLLVVDGNHDISKDNFELFFTLFPFPENKIYRTLDFGRTLSLIFLDTDHFHPIEGEQTKWLEQALLERQNIPFRFAVYHEAAYPSFYPYDGKIPTKIRALWCPLFDKYHLSGAFENHNHAFKKTYPIFNQQIDPEGIIYFGDGCWGAIPRKTNDMWYLEKRGRKANVYCIELTESKAFIQAIDLVGKPLDTVEITRRVQKTLETNKVALQ